MYELLVDVYHLCLPYVSMNATVCSDVLIWLSMKCMCFSAWQLQNRSSASQSSLNITSHQVWLRAKLHNSDKSEFKPSSLAYSQVT